MASIFFYIYFNKILTFQIVAKLKRCCKFVVPIRHTIKKPIL